jgi:sialate O-acetylesterase
VIRFATLLYRSPARERRDLLPGSWSLRTGLLLIALGALPFASAPADVALPPIFGDRMVLQRDLPIPVWGTAEPGETITVEFAGNSRRTTAAADGQWQVALDPIPASAQPRELSVRGRNTLVFRDVLVGEVWFLSGQSNMEKPLGPRAGQRPTDNYEEELTRADCATLRLFQVPRYGRPKPDDASLGWHACTADALMRTKFSAAGYYFGRELVRELRVPVGLIHASFGGTRIEAWMPPEAFELDPALTSLRVQKYPAWVIGTQPTELFTTMVAPHAPYGLRGFLWYQGETNCLNAEHFIYATKMRALVATWRQRWHRADAPFYYAQLAPFGYAALPNREKQLTAHALPALREAQFAALDVPHTGIIPTSDLAGDGSDLHPTNKQDVGIRFARMALAETYGRAIAAQAPRLKSARLLRDRRFEVMLEHADGLHPRPAGPSIQGFEVAGADRIFVPADAFISGERIVVWAPPLAKDPVALRYGWHELALPTVFNGRGLPLLPFRTDDWPVTLEVEKDAP